MRLINVDTFELHEFFGDQIPPYAILSHTWGDQEISYEDWLYARRLNPRRWGWVHVEEEINEIKSKAGYQKIKRACRTARRDGHLWLWVDTNCINKSNSTELSEAINTMFQWYERSQICYAYLADVHKASEAACWETGSDFRKSRWLRRGWTLQELIAPSEVMFLSSSWKAIGTKQDLAPLLTQLTNVSGDVLLEPGSYKASGIAEKMRWVSNRRTTRDEDMAYCLMGVFDVNMPLLYGEGDKAFQRLQVEITRQQPDISILVWQKSAGMPRHLLNLFISPQVESDLTLEPLLAFASGPERFELDGSVTGLGVSSATHFRVDGLGVAVRLPLIATLSKNFCFALLPRLRMSDDRVEAKRMIWIPLVHIEGHRYTRVQFPAVTFEAPETNYGKSMEIVLPTHGGQLHGTSQMMMSIRYPGRLFLEGQERPPALLLLTFPQDLKGFDLIRSFPNIHNEGFRTGFVPQPLLLALYPCETNPSLAVGGLLFSRTDMRRVELLFVARLTGRGSRNILSWTCRHIVDWPSSPEESSQEATQHDIDRKRYESMLETVSTPEQLNSHNHWRLEENITRLHSRDGHVLMDDKLFDPSTSKFCSPTTFHTLNSCPVAPWITVQITFPARDIEA